MAILSLIRKHIHPLGGHIIWWNIILLVFIKLVLPYSAFQQATLIKHLALFDSREIVAITNRVRSQNNLSTLRPNWQLDLAASQKLDDMINKGYFAHVSPIGLTPWFWIKTADYTYETAGENLAIGFPSAEDTVRAWINSESHKANILNAQYQDTGIAVGRGEINGKEGIIVVQMFGKPQTASIKLAELTLSQPQPTPQLPVPVPSETVVLSHIQSAPQPVSTDRNIKPVQEPIKATLPATNQLTKLINTANLVFSIYIAGFVFLSAVAFLILEKKRYMALRFLGHTNIFLASLAISSASIDINAFIF